MRVSVRRGTFETNSSSTHAVCIMPGDVYEAFLAGEIGIDCWKVNLDPAYMSDVETVGDDATFPMEELDDMKERRREEARDEAAELAESFCGYFTRYKEDDAYAFKALGLLTYDMLSGADPQADIYDADRARDDYEISMPDAETDGCMFDEPLPDGSHRISFGYYGG